MSSTVFATQNPSPAVTRRPPISNEDTGNSSQRSTNRRSLSSKLRNLFRKDSPSPNRTTSNDGRPPPTPSRQKSSSPSPRDPSTEAPHLRAPTVGWPFGKKTTKTSAPGNTPKTSKKKIKDNRKTKPNKVPPMEISSPIYGIENQTSIRGQDFVPRTPEFTHDGTGRIQSSSSYEGTTTKGFRDYVVIDQSQQYQQVIVPDVDVFTPPRYTSDRSRSPSMNRRPLSNTNVEYQYHHDISPTSSVAIPYPDIDVLPTPQRKRKIGDAPSLTAPQILAGHTPLLPQTSSLPPVAVQPPTVTTKPTEWKSLSSSTLNNTGGRSTTSSGKDVDVPKLKSPMIPFGSTSSKKKPKRTKSQSRNDGMTGSSSTINNLVQLNPVTPNRSWASTYGSLPDAEIMYGSSLSTLKPLKTNTNKYPWLSAIVQHHMNPSSIYYNERPPITTTTTTTTATNFQRPQRFETSTTTPEEYDPRQQWSNPSINHSGSPSSSAQRHDAYIRPFTPQKPTIPADISTIHVGRGDLHRRSPSPPPRPTRYDTPEPPATYRSSTTIYTKDKQRYVNGGEIRTWSSQENGISDHHIDSYQKPYVHVRIEVPPEEKATDRYEQQVVPPKIKDNYDEYRYSPRAHEKDLYGNQPKVKDNDDDQVFQEEERYEVSFEYERQHQQHSYETGRYYDELRSANQYSDDIDDDKNLVYSSLKSTTRASNITERDKIYNQSSRSYTDSERMQEPFETVAPVKTSELVPRTYSLKRSDSYDGLGICISADAQTRSNHFIREVELGSPGYRAGLRNNDRIISINGINIENVDFNNVLILIKQGLDNDNLQLSVIHEPEHI